MPTFVSKGGLWHAAKEKVGGLVYKGKKVFKKSELPDSILISGDELRPGDPFIYNGLDREALKILNTEGYDLNGDKVLGTDFRHEPEFLQAIRNMNFPSVAAYLKHIGYDEEKAQKEFEEKAATVKSHEISKKVAEINVMGGGKDFSGSGNDVKGGWKFPDQLN